MCVEIILIGRFIQEDNVQVLKRDDGSSTINAKTNVDSDWKKFVQEQKEADLTTLWYELLYGVGR